MPSSIWVLWLILTGYLFWSHINVTAHWRPFPRSDGLLCAVTAFLCSDGLLQFVCNCAVTAFSAQWRPFLRSDGLFCAVTAFYSSFVCYVVYGPYLSEYHISLLSLIGWLYIPLSHPLCVVAHLTHIWLNIIVCLWPSVETSHLIIVKLFALVIQIVYQSVSNLGNHVKHADMGPWSDIFLMVIAKLQTITTNLQTKNVK